MVASLAVLLAGVALPWMIRLALGLSLVAINVPVLRTGVLLLGSRAVRSLEWDEQGCFKMQSEPVKLRPSSFRLGIGFLVLWFSTSAGSRVVLIDGGRQDPVAFRRLSRHLARGELIPSAPKV